MRTSARCTSGTRGLEGFFQAPTILAGVENSWRVARGVFASVLAVIPRREKHEAITTARRVESGWVQVTQGGGQVVGQPWGECKDSGIGRVFAIEGAIEGFTQTKRISVKFTV